MFIKNNKKKQLLGDAGSPDRGSYQHPTLKCLPTPNLESNTKQYVFDVSPWSSFNLLLRLCVQFVQIISISHLTEFHWAGQLDWNVEHCILETQ